MNIREANTSDTATIQQVHLDAFDSTAGQEAVLVSCFPAGKNPCCCY